MKRLDRNKPYKVSGEVLYLILELSSLYETPSLVVNGNYGEQGSMIVTNKEQVQYIPFFTEKRDFLIGKLVSEFEKMEWEEV